MESTRHEELKALIHRLESSATPAASPKDAEQIMGEILAPLFSEEGYTVSPLVISRISASISSQEREQQVPRDQMKLQSNTNIIAKAP